jgi:hypothetical protein
MFRPNNVVLTFSILTLYWTVVISFGCAAVQQLRFPVQICQAANYPRTPVIVRLDFGECIEAQKCFGVIDPNSIEVKCLTEDRVVDHTLSEDFGWGQAGLISWLMTSPKNLHYTIQVDVIDKRLPLQLSSPVPRIGVGDLLRYNAGEPLSGLHDLNNDGKRDLLGCWNYAYAPGLPWDGIIMYPGESMLDRFQFGSLTHLRYVTREEPEEFRFFSSIYMHADFADFNGDGLLDIVYSPRQGDTFQLFMNTGRQDDGGLPVFEAADQLSRPRGAWNPCRAVDLDQDGALDIVVGTPGQPEGCYWLRNANPDGWPVVLTSPEPLNVSEGVCFFDIDGDGLVDAIGLRALENGGVHEYEIEWRRNLGEVEPAFGEPGLLVLHQVYQKVSFFQHQSPNAPHFASGKVAKSQTAVISLSDQAWPWFTDWDGDGDLDMLVGGGYGWPRIVLNEGSAEQPRYTEPRRILSNGREIRLLRNEILGKPLHDHNMGYSYPVFEDWDGDGLRDLFLPNETNRIFWYKNIGTAVAPELGPQRLVQVEGYKESDETRRRSAERAWEKTYPLEDEQPFFWRTGAAVFDWNGDGLMDLATHDGKERRLTLFTQFRDASDGLHLKRDRELRLEDGRVIDDRIVGRSAHWTESFRPVDWDRDGLMDLIYSCAGTRPSDGSIYLLRNVGSRKEAVFAAPRMMKCFGKAIKVTNHGPHPWAGDVDGDGLPDLVACVEWSVYPFYSHAALEMDAPPAYTIGEVEVVEHHP